MQLALSLCDKMLGIKRYLCDTDFFSGGNYKFPILLKPNLKIRLNIEEFERRIRLDIQFNKSAKIGGNSPYQQTPSERADVSALTADIRRRQRALLTGNARPCRERA